MSRPMSSFDSPLAGLLERPLAEVGIDDLVVLFEAGAKEIHRWKLGLEIELIPLLLGEPTSADYPRISRVLSQLGDRHALEHEHDESGALIGLKGDGYSYSLEPGGQMEIATKPYRALARLRQAVDQFASEMAAIAREEGIRLVAIGHHPYADRDSIPKMPKARYTTMRSYLPRRGSRGLDMMHLTGSVQCAVDFSDEANMIEKVRTAARVSPFLTALTSASPFSNGRPNGMKSMRYEIWRDVDNARSGIWPEMLDQEGLTFARYVRRALSVPAMFFIRDGHYRVAEPRPFESYGKAGFEGTTVTVADFVDHLTSLFPEIRIKNYIELRGSDCVVPAEAVAVAGFWRGILDVPEARQVAEERLSPLTHAELTTLQADVARGGLDASSPVGPVREIARWLVETAHRGLAHGTPDCAECMLPLVERAEAGRSPADDLLEIGAKEGLEAALAKFTL